MIGINDLPEEILLLILEQVAQAQEHGSSPAIVQCLRVNQTWSRLALPLLYCIITLNKCFDSGGDSLLRLLITLLQNTSKASLVQSLVLNDSTCETVDSLNDRDNALKRPGPEITRLVESTISAAFQDDTEKRTSWLREAKAEAQESIICFLAILLVSMPNLQKLSLSHIDDALWLKLDELVAGLMRNCVLLGREPPLKVLEELHIGHGPPEYPASTVPLAVVAKWPKVRVISVSCSADGDEVSDPEFNEAFLGLPPRRTELRNISLVPNCKILGSHLTNFMNTPRALKTFEYQIGHVASYMWYEAWLDFDYRELMQALSQQLDSLEVIRLRLDQSLEDFSDSGWDPLDFSSFKSLQELEVDASFLYGGGNGRGGPNATTARNNALTIIPASIREFTVTMCDHATSIAAVKATFERILASQESKFPNLKVMKIAHVQKLALECAKTIEATVSIGQAKGVLVKALICDYDYDAGLVFGYSDLEGAGLKTRGSITEAEDREIKALHSAA